MPQQPSAGHPFFLSLQHVFLKILEYPPPFCEHIVCRAVPVLDIYQNLDFLLVLKPDCLLLHS